MPTSRFLREHLHQKVLFWACISRVHAQVPVVTAGKLTHVPGVTDAADVQEEVKA